MPIAKLSGHADQVETDTVKVITRNGADCVAPIDVLHRDCDRRLERERAHLLLLDEAERGVVDVAAGRTRDARAVLAELKRSARARC